TAGCAQVVVGVAPGVYRETLTIPSRVGLVGSGAEQTFLQGDGSGSVVTFSGVVTAQIRGFDITGSGAAPADAAIRVEKNASNVIISRNVLHGNQNGVTVKGGAGSILFNTIVDNLGTAVQVDARDVAGIFWVAQNNIIVGSATGLAQIGATSVFTNSFNLLYNNAAHFSGLSAGAGTILDQDPLFDVAYALQKASPAVDAANPFYLAPAGGGARADLGYRELLATPISLLFGAQGLSCAQGNSGVDAQQAALVAITDPGLPVTATLPGEADWADATLLTPDATGSHWESQHTLAAGLYRLYTRPVDQVGNVADYTAWFQATVIADESAPVVAWLSPDDGSETVEAAIQVRAEVADYADSSTGPSFDVQSVYFEVNGVYYPAEWDDTGWDPAAQEPRTFWTYVPLADGSNTVAAVAVDRAGHTSTVSRTFTATTPGHIATITRPLPGAAVNEPAITVSGYARFNTITGTGHVSVTVAGGGTFIARLDDPTQSLTPWSAQVTLPTGEGTFTVAATAYQDAGRGLSTSRQTAAAGGQLIVVDTTPPTITITAPAEGGIVTRTISFQGAATDEATGSGLARVELSFDGGLTWRAAALTGNDWHYDWTPPAGQNYFAVPVRARAVDHAGNEAIVVHAVVVDNVPPPLLAPVSFNLDPGTHHDAYTTLAISWTLPAEASGETTARLDVNQTPIYTPTTMVGGNNYTAVLDQSGDWFVHLNATDAVGLSSGRRFDPWHVGTFAEGSLACADRLQTIVLDGALDTGRNEWREDIEFLDDDERGGTVQRLYTTWDGPFIYIGWRGTSWRLSGALVVYLDVADGGAADPVPGYGAAALPFAADYAAVINDEDDGTLWRYAADGWQPQPGSPDLVFASGSNDTEIRLGWGAGVVGGDVRLLAVAVDDAGQPWSVFPTGNALAGPWTEAYYWTDRCQVAAPNAGQPRSNHLSAGLSSPQAPLAAWGPGDTLQYDVAIANGELDGAVEGLQLHLTASDGLGFQTLV
ncbi:MAG: Ig-like domain-containing protein, partial [Chloroflexi bacterium]|nr:Ig-like domain-containing protein [Chloroflexota bacterium]